jgi:tetratricopeptide (TPR) repeat protein
LQPTASELDAWSESEFLSRGSSLLRHRDLAGSIQAFRAGVTHFPDSPTLRTGLGIALSARCDYENAIASLLRATDLAPSDPRPYFVLAKLYRGSSAPGNEVPKRLQRLVTLDPRNPQALYYYALTLAKRSPGDDAALKQMSLLKGALAINPNFADAHLQLGIVYAALSNYPDAIREYQAAVRLKPDLVAAHYRLAQAYERTGEKAAAQAELDLSERLRRQTSTNPR